MAVESGEIYAHVAVWTIDRITIRSIALRLYEHTFIVFLLALCRLPFQQAIPCTFALLLLVVVAYLCLRYICSCRVWQIRTTIVSIYDFVVRAPSFARCFLPKKTYRVIMLSIMLGQYKPFSMQAQHVFPVCHADRANNATVWRCGSATSWVHNVSAYIFRIRYRL